MKKLALMPLVAGLLASPLLMADDLDDLLGGFEADEVVIIQDIVQEIVPPEEGDLSPWQVSGEVSLYANYAYDHGTDKALPWQNNWSRLQAKTRIDVDYQASSASRAHADVSVDYDLAYGLNGRGNYPTAALDEYESSIELGGFWWQSSLTPDLDIKIGRQNMVQGSADMLRINDTVNNLDNRYPGLTQLEDLRLPVALTRLDYYLQDWQLTAAMQHEVRAPKIATLGVDAFPSSAFSSDLLSSLPSLQTPQYNSSDSPFMLAATGQLLGVDSSFYYGRVLDQRWHKQVTPTAARVYGLIDQAGTALSMAQGSWLWKLEAARFTGLAYSNATTSKSRTDVMLGFDYNGWSDTGVTLEWARRQIHDFEASMAQAPDLQLAKDMQLALNIKYNFNHDQTNANLVYTANGAELQGGGMGKVWLEHEVSQAWKLSGGLINYYGGTNATYNALSNNDKVFMEMHYSF
ncbi:MAG: hypothetical protein PSN46_07695 [Gammaproteobacteria bacterium]|nr:hypothetical protein [Gammaproteobacteria bacterium]